MKTNPRVSVILPTYNGAKFIAESIKSIIAQKFTDWELIIVNYCSTDETLDIVTKFADQDKRIKVISNKENKKLPGALNVGFAAANGEYFTWTSDDNIARANWLETMVNALDSDPGIAMVVADMDYMDENEKFMETASSRYQHRNAKQLAYICNVGAAFMYRRAIADKVGKYDESTFCAEDYDYWCRIALNGNIKYIPDNIYRYRRHGGSLTATKRNQQIAKTSAINKKYYAQFITRYKMNWWQRQKMMFLLYPHVPKTACYWLFKAYNVVVFQIGNVLFFWNSKLRHRFKSKFKVNL